MKIILVKEKEDGFLYEVARIVYKNKPVGFTFKPSTQLDVIGKMITDEIDKDKQNDIIGDFSCIKDLFYSYLGDDYEINSEFANENRMQTIRMYLSVIANKYNLIIIDLKKDKDFYELYKKGIYRKIKTKPVDLPKDKEVKTNAINLIDKLITRSPKMGGDPSYTSVSLKHIQPPLPEYLMYKKQDKIIDDFIEKVITSIYSYAGIPPSLLDNPIKQDIVSISKNDIVLAMTKAYKNEN